MTTRALTMRRRSKPAFLPRTLARQAQAAGRQEQEVWSLVAVSAAPTAHTWMEFFCMDGIINVLRWHCRVNEGEKIVWMLTKQLLTLRGTTQQSTWHP